MEPDMTLLATVFIMALTGYGIKYLLRIVMKERDTSVDPDQTEKLREWNRKWEPPEKGGFYKWDEGKQEFVEPTDAVPKPPPVHPYYGDVTLVDEYSASKGKHILYVEYRGRRYRPWEFERKFGTR